MIIEINVCSSIFYKYARLSLIFSHYSVSQTRDILHLMRCYCALKYFVCISLSLSVLSLFFVSEEVNIRKITKN